jgi:hypothetical protein
MPAAADPNSSTVPKPGPAEMVAQRLVDGGDEPDNGHRSVSQLAVALERHEVEGLWIKDSGGELAPPPPPTLCWAVSISYGQVDGHGHQLRHHRLR